MAENNNTNWINRNTDEVIETFTDETINENREKSLNLYRIEPNSTVGQMVETINANFMNIAMHGGGPAGLDGEPGMPGEDGTNSEYIYILNNTEPKPDVHYPSSNTGKKTLFDTLKSVNITQWKPGVFWYNHAQPISIDHKNEYVMARYRIGDGNWEYTNPTLWAHWGENGMDGDGMEYIFMRSETELTNTQLNDSIQEKSDFDQYQKIIFNINGFYPGEGWFRDDSNKEKAKNAIDNSGSPMSTSDFNLRWNNKFSLCVSGYNWTADPKGIDKNFQYEYVSIRRAGMNSGGSKEWDNFSKPVLWAKYSMTTFKSFAFTVTNIDDDISNIQPTGGSFSNPKPDPYVVGNKQYIWTDAPVTTQTKSLVWMTSATVNEFGIDGNWSKPKKMTDSTEFQVEWSANDINGTTLSNAVDALALSTYNFGTYLANNGYDESAAETAWRNAVRTNLDITFGDSSENAILMATCQYNNGKWTNWQLVRVRGENGDNGTSLNITGRISYELDYPSGTYDKSNISDFFDTNKATEIPNPHENELAIVYPHEMTSDNIYYGDSNFGGALYIWKYKNSIWTDYNDLTNGEIPGNAYTSLNGHMIVWDGDSWQDIGKITGESGKTYKVLIKYANDSDDSDGSENDKVFVGDNVEEIAHAKWIGILTYIDGEENPNNFGVDHPRWSWSLFKGQDGYGYEYIYKATSNKINPPQVPNTTPEQDTIDGYVPTVLGWVDEPIEPTSTNRYIWMCWRKYNRSVGTWGKFMGKNGQTYPNGIAQLWSAYVNGITEVKEYFHADNNMSPNDLNTAITDTTYWKSSKADTGWSASLPYLFNVEVIGFTDSTSQRLDPHLIGTWDKGIVDIIDYYCINNSGSIAPHISNGTPVISGSGTEGIDYWTTNASAQTVSANMQYLWNISMKEYADGHTSWTTPCVVGVYNNGSQGQNSIYADLDNEMDSFQIDENRKILVSKTFKTNINMYNGSSSLSIKSCTYSGQPTGITISLKYVKDGTATAYTAGNVISDGADSIEMTISLAKDNTIGEEYSKISIIVTGEDDSIRMISYTLVGTTYPFTYRIRPSENAISIDGSTLTPTTITLSVDETAGPNVTTYTHNGENFSLKSKVTHKNGSSETKIDVPTVPAAPAENGVYTFNTSGLVAGDRVTFTVEVDADGDPGLDTILDSETIYVLKQGERGQAGNGYQYLYIRYDSTANYSETICTVYNRDQDVPLFKFGDTQVISTDVSTESKGADSQYTYEYRSERHGNDDDGWTLWSVPGVIAKYFDAGNIQSQLSGIVEQEVRTATSAIQTNLSNAMSDVSELLSKFDVSTGKIKDNFISDDTKAGIVNGYLLINNLTSEIEEIGIGGFTVNVSGTPMIFSTWINNETSEVRSLRTTYDALEGTITELNTDVAGKLASNTFTAYTTNASNRFAKIENDVVNMHYLSDADGYLLVEELDGTRRQALDNNGNPAKTWLETRESDRGLLIPIVTEIAGITETVSKGVAAVNIFVDVNDHSAGAIFEATEGGSSIALAADKVGIKSNHFNLDSSGVTMKGNLFATNQDGEITAGVIGDNVTSADTDIKFFAGTTISSSVTNFSDIYNLINTTASFKVMEDGKLIATNAYITGSIKATSLEITGNASSTLTNFIESVGNARGWDGSGSSPSVSEYDDDWLTGALSETNISKGLAITGNLIVADRNGYYTAGVLGANTNSGRDLRFFAGNTISNKESAPFRVYDNGDLYATNATITGTITADNLTIRNNALNTFKSLVFSAGSGRWVTPAEISSFITDTALSNYATQSDISSANAWLNNAFDKTISVSGLAMTGNIFVADSNANVTAGMMGANTDASRDLRFFAGDAGDSAVNAVRAPFRVYSDGTLYATMANITGAINATTLTISSAAKDTLIELIASNAVTASTLSDYVTQTAFSSGLNNLSSSFNNTLNNYATKSQLSSLEYKDGWLTSAFSKTLTAGGLTLTGNVFTANASAVVTAGMMGGTTGSHDLRFFAGSATVSNSTVNAENAQFRVYSDGKLYASDAYITGTITANNLSITGNALNTFNNLVFTAGSGRWVTPAEISSFITDTALSNYATQSDISSANAWLNNAFDKTIFVSGLAMTGNIFVADSNANVTAGMMGATTNNNVPDLRFFAGEAGAGAVNAVRAPFRVYSDGTLYATMASITGAINATTLTLSYSAEQKLIELIASNAVTAATLSDYVTQTVFNNTLNNYATKPELSSIDTWLTSAFSKTLTAGGLTLTGNVFAADSNAYVTAGMMGGTTGSHDLRFFAGEAGAGAVNAENAPFRVYSDGKLYASDAYITGNILAKNLTVDESASVQGLTVDNLITSNDKGTLCILNNEIRMTDISNNIRTWVHGNDITNRKGNVIEYASIKSGILGGSHKNEEAWAANIELATFTLNHKGNSTDTSDSIKIPGFIISIDINLINAFNNPPSNGGNVDFTGTVNLKIQSKTTGLTTTPIASGNISTTVQIDSSGSGHVNGVRYTFSTTNVNTYSYNVEGTCCLILSVNIHPILDVTWESNGNFDYMVSRINEVKNVEITHKNEIAKIVEIGNGGIEVFTNTTHYGLIGAYRLNSSDMTFSDGGFEFKCSTYGIALTPSGFYNYNSSSSSTPWQLGLGTSTSASQYFIIDSENNRGGFEFRTGSNGLNITTTGIHTYTDGSWHGGMNLSTNASHYSLINSYKTSTSSSSSSSWSSENGGGFEFRCGNYGLKLTENGFYVWHGGHEKWYAIDLSSLTNLNN